MNKIFNTTSELIEQFVKDECNISDEYEYFNIESYTIEGNLLKVTYQCDIWKTKETFDLLEYMTWIYKQCLNLFIIAGK